MSLDELSKFVGFVAQCFLICEFLCEFFDLYFVGVSIEYASFYFSKPAII